MKRTCSKTFPKLSSAVQLRIALEKVAEDATGIRTCSMELVGV